MQFQDRLFITHIPKTAGTTLRQIVQQIYPPEQVCGIYSDIRFLSAEDFPSLSEGEKNCYRVFIGHFEMKFLKHLPTSLPVRCMTVLRDPVARVRSQYNHLANVLHDKGFSFSELMIPNNRPDWMNSLPASIDNAQVRYLCGTEEVIPWGQCSAFHLQQAKDNLHKHFDIVGCSEFLDETLYLAHTLLGWPATPVRKANVGAEMKNNVFSKITAEDEARILEINQLDVELYEFARNLMWECIAQTAPDWQQRLAEFKGELAVANNNAEYALNTALYLQLNPDVRAASIDPMFHFLFHGQFESRDGTPPLSNQRKKFTRRCFEPWQPIDANTGGGLPCPERPCVSIPEKLEAARINLRYQLMIGVLDETCRQCTRVVEIALPDYLQALGRRGLMYDTVVASQRGSIATAPAARTDNDQNMPLQVIGNGETETGVSRISSTILKHAHDSMRPQNISQFKEIATDQSSKVVNRTPVSRNSLCPCGSGKRYKHCCGAKAPGGNAAPGLRDIMISALARQNAKDLAGAEALYQKALSIQPDEPDCLHMLGVVYMERFRYAEALDLLFRAAEQTNWKLPQIRYNLGLVIARMMTRDANARQELLLAKHLEWQKLLASHKAPITLPLVSVIIPSYNHAGYISEALASVFGQTYRNLELVVIDDGSADVSPEIIAKLLERSPFPHRFFARTNRGAEQTLNEGAELANGSFLAFLNSDDCFAPDRIEQMVAHIAARGAQWGFSGVTFIDHQDVGIDSTNPLAQSHLRSVSNVLGKITNSFAFLEFNPCISTGNLFVEKSLFRRTGGFRFLRYNHDWDFCLRVSTLSEPVFVEAPLYRYRFHGKNTISESNNKPKTDADKCFAEYYQLLEGTTTAENELSPIHADNRTLLYKLGLGIGHGGLLPIDRLRSMSMHWLSKLDS